MNNNIITYLIFGIIGIVLFFLIFRQPYIGVVFTIATLPVIDLFPDIPLFSSIAVPLGLVTLVSYLFQTKSSLNRQNKGLDPVVIFGFLFMFWTVISNPEAAIFGKDRVWVLTFVQLWVLMALSGELLVTPQRQKTAMVIFAIAATISALFAIFQGEIAEDALSSARVAGLATNANQAARYFVIALVFFYYLRIKTKSPFNKLLYLVGILVTFIGVFFTVSRSGILLLFGAFGLILIFQPRVKNKVGLVILLVVGLIVLSFFSDSIFRIIRDIFPAIQQGTDTVGLRYNLWKAGWRMWLDHPFNGVGIGQYNQNLRRYMINMVGPTRGSLSSHNTYVQVLSETGIVGFTLFMGMLINAFKHLWPSASRSLNENEDLRNAWFIILLIISVGGITITDLANKILWMVLGISVVFAKRKTVEATDQLPESVKPFKTSANSIRLRRWMKNVK
ncbi:MAG: O-antigen ligase family protein [Anaerolineaceae bacterium]|nr:O-antigen ligase family protein [Anaerolineaceae bacterium]